MEKSIISVPGRMEDSRVGTVRGVGFGGGVELVSGVVSGVEELGMLI